MRRDYDYTNAHQAFKVTMQVKKSRPPTGKDKPVTYEQQRQADQQVKEQKKRKSQATLKGR